MRLQIAKAVNEYETLIELLQKAYDYLDDGPEHLELKAEIWSALEMME